MESRINHYATNFGALLVWIIVVIFTGLAIFTLYELAQRDVLSYFKNQPLRFLGLALVIILCSAAGFFIASYLLKIKKHHRYNILVNDQGAFIFSQDGKISEQFLYSELCAAEENYNSDISVLINYRFNTTKLIIHQKTGSGEIKKLNLSFQREYYVIKNRFQLYRHFLKGVQIFRPDIKIQYHTLLHFQLIPSPELTESQKKTNKIFNIGFGIFGLAILGFIIYSIRMIFIIINK